MKRCMFTAKTLDDLKSGATIEGDSGINNEEKPVWYDDAKFKRGQAFFKKHVAAIGFSMHYSLVSGFSIVNLLEPLVFTNASDTSDKAFKRYMLTFYHIFLWLTGDVFDKNSKAYRSITTVRGIHNNVAKRMRDVHKDNVFVSQYDLGLVQSGFFGAVLLYPRAFGIRCSIQELEDYVYTWRVFGYCLGIEDKYNICSGTIDETKALAKAIEQKCLIPALQNPPKKFDQMADAYIGGMNKPLLFNCHSKLATLSFAWDNFGMVSPYKMSIGDWWIYFQLKLMTFLMLYVPGFEILVNYLSENIFVYSMENVMSKKIKAEYVKYTNN